MNKSLAFSSSKDAQDGGGGIVRREGAGAGVCVDEPRLGSWCALCQLKRMGLGVYLLCVNLIEILMCTTLKKSAKRMGVRPLQWPHSTFNFIAAASEVLCGP